MKEVEMRYLAITPIALALAAMPAAAQTNQQQAPQTDKCRAGADQTSKQQPNSNSLTKTLGDCGGVLKPPATGDADMTTPPPAEGKTPVIKPGEVPVQPPKQ
jgi:hypothetical protein